MHTNRLFRENVYLRECDASIRSVSTREDKVLIYLQLARTWRKAACKTWAKR